MKRKVKLTIECDLIGQLLPSMKIYYEDKVITLLFHKSLWGDKKALIELAKVTFELCGEKRISEESGDGK